MKIIGLDLVFSGISGVAIVDENNNIKKAGVLSNSVSSSSEFQKKIERGYSLSRAVLNIIKNVDNAFLVIEYPNWHQKPSTKYFDPISKKWITNKANAGRDRVAVQSLSLARGLVMTHLFLAGNFRIIPVYQTVQETRSIIFGKNVSKDHVFQFINTNYRLNLSNNDKNKNITDAIALTRAFNRVFFNPLDTQLKRNLHDKVVNIKNALFTLERNEKEVLKINKKNYLSKNAEKKPLIGSIDISSLNPGTVVLNSEKELVFHQNFPLKNRSKILEIAELQTIQKIFTSFVHLKEIGVEKILFEYSDWHRTGTGKDFYIDVKAINSLFFTYGALMALSDYFQIPIIAVGAKKAKKSVLNKSNATKKDVLNFIKNLYSELTNEHTRDAALIAYNYIKGEK